MSVERRASMTVHAPGSLATVQDLGRPGYAALGVTRSGAADRPALRLANRLVGNAESCAAIEATFGGLRVEFDAPTLLALTGAPLPAALNGRAIGMHGPVWAEAGEELSLGLPALGLRTYLAVRGGIAVPPILGSRSTDLLSGLGPAPLVEGTRLPLGPRPEDWPVVSQAPVAPLPEIPVLRLHPGPRDDWFDPEALRLLCTSDYEVTEQSNRVGLRLAGPPLRRRVSRELPSEGMVRGAIQVPASGLPVLFHVDHPVTGGYPVIAVVDEDDLPAAAQVRPGGLLRFRLATGPG
ncbi:MULTISPECIES: biotin-dependent carboxyltransferase family protein [Actinoalloteichus]|uniref:Biotin-dependent carboxylase-like protein n=1 Tax=Actinoalloteichus fjordicus TaxID=1612552 RepID=A0AAC9LC58_9PSEU|nr:MULTISPECIES: biotin-dependent carboxyltransferase family protein [Actinoalloteichus]APU13997.1 biotin-dependent carboxylase-like protein [Actinoalloteichus fjordicus]APU19943.1 biotin-dependent carboxylase-like protein [Actinoalloteichus sp. GBA129-24]